MSSGCFHPEIFWFQELVSQVNREANLSEPNQFVVCPANPGDKKSESRFSSLNSASQTLVKFADQFTRSAPAVKNFLSFFSAAVPFPELLVNYCTRAVTFLLLPRDSSHKERNPKIITNPTDAQGFF